MSSGTPLPSKVVVGEKKELKNAAEVGKSASMVNAYNAFIMAEQLSKNPKAKLKIQG